MHSTATIPIGTPGEYNLRLGLELAHASPAHLRWLARRRERDVVDHAATIATGGVLGVMSSRHIVEARRTLARIRRELQTRAGVVRDACPSIASVGPARARESRPPPAREEMSDGGDVPPRRLSEIERVERVAASAPSRCSLCGRSIRAGADILEVRTAHAYGDVVHARSHVRCWIPSEADAWSTAFADAAFSPNGGRS